MAQSTAQRTKSYRERKKAKGSKVIGLTLTSCDLSSLGKIAKANSKTKQSILLAFAEAAISRIDMLDLEYNQLIKLGATEEELRLYNKRETERAIPTFAEVFLNDIRGNQQ
jgi:hypothetical protein